MPVICAGINTPNGNGSLLLRSDHDGIATLTPTAPQYNAFLGTAELLIELQAALDAIARRAGMTTIELHTAATAVFFIAPQPRANIDFGASKCCRAAKFCGAPSFHLVICHCTRSVN